MWKCLARTRAGHRRWAWMTCESIRCRVPPKATWPPASKPRWPRTGHCAPRWRASRLMTWCMSAIRSGVLRPWNLRARRIRRLCWRSTLRSLKSKRSIVTFPGARNKIHVVPNGVSPRRFSPGLAPALPRLAGAFTVGFVGTLKPWHGLSILVEAFAQLRRRHPQTRLLIVGDGPERDRLVADLAAAGLTEAVHLAGAVDASAVPGWLASMDVGVAPYPPLAHFYFSPLRVYEYMAAGLPVVASRIGQLKSLIEEGRNGLLVTTGDAAGLAAALERLHSDPKLRARLGQAARTTVLKQYTWDAVAQRVLRLAGLGATPHADGAALRT